VDQVGPYLSVFNEAIGLLILINAPWASTGTLKYGGRLESFHFPTFLDKEWLLDGLAEF